MKRRFFTLLVVALLACACGPALRAGAGSTPRLALRAARLLDPAAGTVQRDVVVLVTGERIAAVVSAARYTASPGDSLVELGDVTLLPGLIDAHVHLSLAGPPRTNAAATLAAGFTTVADLGAVSHRITALRDSIALGTVQGPRVLTAGRWIGVQGGVCEFGGIGVPPDADAFRARVRDNIQAGANLIKACVTGWPAVAWAYPDSAELSPALLGALVDEAHRGGRRVVAHALSREGVRRALAAGVDGLVHAAYLDDALALELRERGVWLIPTLASLTGADTSVATRALVDAVRRAHRAGVTIVFGTDGGVLPHGANAREAAALHAAGVPPLDILRAATVHAARALGIADSVGAVGAGMSADLIGVAGDPLVDIDVIQRPRFVMIRGRVTAGPPP